jgi:hypothetical protein
VSRPVDRGGLLPCQHDDTDERLLMGEYSRGLPYDLMTFEERDQVDAERTDAIRDRVQPARAARYPTLRSPPTVKIIDRIKTYIRQNRDDKRLAVSTAHETPEPEAVTEPVTEPVTELVTESAAEPVTEPVTELVTESAAEPVTEPVTEPAAEPVTEPVTEPAAEPAAEPVTEPTTAPAACPRCGATGEAPCTTPSGKATKTHKGREQ